MHMCKLNCYGLREKKVIRPDLICLVNYLQRYIGTWIYNLNTVPQITGFLLAEAIILIKTNPCSGSKKLKRGNGES